MSCEECGKALAIDGTEPPCFAQISSPLEGEGRVRGGLDFEDSQSSISNLTPGTPGVTACWIPQLDDAGSRIMEIRQKLITLGELVGPETVMKMYEVTKEDLDLLETVETELKKASSDTPAET